MKTIILVLVFALALALAEEEFDTANCLRGPDPGQCWGAITTDGLYYYDFNSRSCKISSRGDCRVNYNIFRTEAECMKKCGDVIVFQ